MESMAERLIAAIEGELDGLAIDAEQAKAILSYTLKGSGKFRVDINNSDDGWVQVTITGDGVNDLTEERIEYALSSEHSS